MLSLRTPKPWEALDMAIRPCEPNIVEAVVGWLATTPRDHPYHIGVVGDSPEEAQRRFAAAFAAWQELHERAEQISLGPSVAGR